MIKKDDIRPLQDKIRLFRKERGKLFEYMVECPLEDRINYMYKAIFPGLSRYGFYWRFFLSRLAWMTDYSPLKVLFYRCAGIKIGKGVFISPQVNIDVHFPELMIIEDYAILGFGASLFVHDFISSKYRLGRVTIGKGSVIGASVIVGCGVDIGEMANIPVRSVILKDVPANYKAKLKDA